MPCLGWNYPFQMFRALPFISGITSSLKPLQSLYTIGLVSQKWFAQHSTYRKSAYL